MSAERVPEGGGPPPEKKEKGKKEPEKGFRWLIKKIKKLSEKPQLTESQGRKLQELEEQKKNLILEFLQQTDFGKTTLAKRDEIELSLRATVSLLTTPTKKNWEEEKTIVLEIFESKKKEAQDHWKKEPADLDKQYQGIAEYELNRVIEEKEKEKERTIAILLQKKEKEIRRREELLKEKEAEREKTAPTTKQPKAGEKEEEKEGAQEKVQREIENLEEELAKEPVNKKVQEELRKYASLYELNPEQKKRMADPDPEKAKENRKEIFLEILKRFGLDQGRHFREADITAQSQWASFLVELSNIAPNEIDEYTARFGFEETVHNLNVYLSGQADISRVKEVVSNIQSNEVDLAVRQVGAAAAFRAYEQAYNRMALIEGEIVPEKATYDPDLKETWIDSWVAGQVKNALLEHIKKPGGINQNEAEKIYEKDYKSKEFSFLRTGYKIFLFTLRGDEIQASLPGTREVRHLGAPKREDLARILDPLLMPIRYWLSEEEGESKEGVKTFLGWEKERDNATELWYFQTGMRRKFASPEEYKKAVQELREKGEIQFNLFDIGGILSISDWRAERALRYIFDQEHVKDVKVFPKGKGLERFFGIELERKLLGKKKDVKVFPKGKGLGRFFGMETERKLLGKKDDAKRIALAHALIRNPFALFRLAEEGDQEKILTAYNSERKKLYPETKPEAKKAFYEKVYDNMSQALENLVYDQQEGLKKLFYDNQGRRREPLTEEIQAFINKEKNRGLDFNFVPGDEKKEDLKRFVKAIQDYFGKESMLDDQGELKLDAQGKFEDIKDIKDIVNKEEKEKAIKERKAREAFERLVSKDVPFSLGTEDLPIELMRFVDLGDQALQRRYRDLSASAEGVKAFWNLISNLGLVIQKEQTIAETLKEIHGHLEEYKAKDANEQMKMLTCRVLDLVKEDKLQKILPWPACYFRDKWKLTSEGEKLFGQFALSLNKDQLRILIERIISSGCFSTEYTKQARKELYKAYRLGFGWTMLERGWRYGPGILIGSVIAIAMTALQQFKKEIEEAAKET